MRGFTTTPCSRHEANQDDSEQSGAHHPVRKPRGSSLLFHSWPHRARHLSQRRYAHEDVELHRKLAVDPHSIAVLGRALGRKGELQTELGNVPAAMATLAEASAIFAELPAEYAPDRAKLLAARAQCLDTTGDVPGALAAWLAAADIWRARPRSNEDRSRLAECLNNAAVCHIRQGDLPSALATQQEAADTAEPLRDQHPDLYTMTYANLVRYQAYGDPHRAAATARRLAAPLPTKVGWDLHTSAETLGANGEYAEAIEAGELALRAAGNDALLTASVLKGISANLAGLGRFTEGAKTAASSVSAWRTVLAAPSVMGEPQVRWNLATALANQAANLLGATLFAEAATCYAAAVAELRPLTTTDPELLPMLADLLNSQARAYDEAQNLDAEVPVLQELIPLRRAYAPRSPTHKVMLARALLALARVLMRLNRPHEALPHASESIDLFYQVHGNNPPQYEQEYALAFLLTGVSLLRTNHPPESVLPLVRALGMAAAANDHTTADASISALRLARSHDPQGVTAEWQRLTGIPFPGTAQDRSTD